MSNNSDLTKAMIELEEDQVNSLVQKKLDAGEDPISIIRQCNEGMTEIGNLYEKKDYYLSELIMAGEIFKNVMTKLEPMLGEENKADQPTKGTVIIGTVKDDIHDIGKDIVVSMLKGTGYDVRDLGVDVPAERFINEIKESGAKVIGLSCLLNFTFPQLKKVVDELQAQGLRDKVKVMIGGAPTNEDVRDFAGADFYGKDPSAAISYCNQVYQ